MVALLTPIYPKCAFSLVRTLQGLGKKLVVYRYKSKANVRRKHGHRQPFTCLVVKSINA